MADYNRVRRPEGRQAALEYVPGFAVRVYGTHDAPLFVAADVCKCLGLANVSKAMYRLYLADRTTVTLTGGKGNPHVNAVTESGLYDLVLQSRVPGAEAFKKWITHDVLPSIRKNGAYGNQANDAADAPRNEKPRRDNYLPHGK